MQEQTIQLDSYAAKSCEWVTYNKYFPLNDKELKEPTALTRTLTEAGNAFESKITEILRSFPGVTIFEQSSADQNSKDEHRAWTLEQINSEAAVIVNGRLPSINGRSGAPDLLVRVGSGYLPVDIKNHKSLKENDASTSLVAPLRNMARFQKVEKHKAAGHAYTDTMQLAHYTQMLKELGFHPDTDQTLGGIIGTTSLSLFEDDEPTGYCVAWYDLTEPTVTVYSPHTTDNKEKISIIDKYDLEFARRMEVAKNASERAVRADLDRPIGIKECETCKWENDCREEAVPDDASFKFTVGRPNVEEWRFLHNKGIRTVEELSSADVESLRAEFTVIGGRDKKNTNLLVDLVRRANMLRSGQELDVQATWPPTVPSADVEIDFDLEWDPSTEVIYQWGLRVRLDQDETTAKYYSELFDPRAIYDQDVEKQLRQHFVSVLSDLLADAHKNGKSVKIFHWTHPEKSKTKEFPEVVELLNEDVMCDLEKDFRNQFFSLNGTSIKVVAPLFGFEWKSSKEFDTVSAIAAASSQPNGLTAELEKWFLDYNESDVAAQAAIRDGLRVAIATGTVAGLNSWINNNRV